MADEEKNEQGDIDDLINELEGLNASEPAEEEARVAPAAADSGGPASPDDIEALLNQAEKPAAAKPIDPNDAAALEELDALLQQEVPAPVDPSSAVAPLRRVEEADGHIPASPGDIDALLAQAESAGSNAPPPPSMATEAEIDALLAQAAQETPAAVQAAETPALAYEMQSFEESSPSDVQHKIDLIGDVNLNVRVELGRRKMYIEDILKLGAGSVVELDKLAGDPLDILVNNRLVARGEVLILNDNFCIRVTEIVKSSEDNAT